MSKIKIFAGLFFALFLIQSTDAQKAILRGQMFDQANNDPISFANIYIEETAGGDVSDLDGFFSIELDPGTYNIVFSYIGYADYKITNLVLTAGQEEVVKVPMSSGLELETVVVTAEENRGSIVGIVTLRNKSDKMLDALSADVIKQAGDGDAGEAIKRVSGVSVEGGKHVYVRGLGDRYTKTTLNGMDIPGLDPDRNSVELDIFPTNLVENLIVYKTFSPDLAGDFTGGNVDITTKSFPDRKTIGASISMGYNPTMHFNSNFLSYEGGGTDFLGMDDGTRKLPFHPLTIIPDPSNADGDELFNITNAFSKNMKALALGNNMNKSAGFSAGNQFNSENTTVGYNFSLSYKDNSTFYEDAQYNTFRFNADQSLLPLNQVSKSNGAVGVNDVFWSAMGGVALKWKEHKFVANAMRLQNGISQAAHLTQINGFENPATIVKDNLEYAQREVTNFLLKGTHALNEGKHKIMWTLSPTIIQVDEPDIRFTAFEKLEDGTFRLAPSVGAEATRTFRNLQELSLAGKADYTFKFKQWAEMDTELKAGISATRKNRTFDIQNFLVRVRDQNALNLSDGNPDNIFLTENILGADDDAGTFVKGNFQPANTYDATSQVLAGYVMNELPINSKLRAIYGVRIEKADIYYTGQNNFGTEVYNNENVLDDLDILPSLNVVYKLKEKMNVRASASRTVARPSFKEKSIAQIQDRISGRTFLGNIDLLATDITNADLRWEAFGKMGQSISLSGFYKAFKNPIELTVFDATAPNNFQPVNVGDASVLGLELEGRKTMDFISPLLSNLSIVANVTLVKSEVTMKDAEFEARTAAKRDGQTIEPTRQMVGQSPYIINGALNYKDIDKGWEANISYNVQGERLSIAGIGFIPDVIETPFNSLNFKAAKSFGKNNSWKASVAVENILDAERRHVYRAYDAPDELFQLLKPGRLFNVGLAYTLN